MILLKRNQTVKKKEYLIVLGSSAKTLASLRGNLIKYLSDKDLDIILTSSKPDPGDLDFFKNFQKSRKLASSEQRINQFTRRKI